MAKGKHKRKTQRAQQEAQQTVKGTGFMENKEMAVKTPEITAKRANETTERKKLSRWQRFKEYAKTSSITDWCIASFTVVLAAAAIYQFIIMGGQLDVMRKDQRAWIAVAQKSGITIGVNIAPTVSLGFTNTGKTPATNIAGNFYVEVVPNGQNPQFEATTMHTTVVQGVILPNAPQEIQASRRRLAADTTDQGESDPLTNVEKSALDDGKAWIAVHGTVSYRDIFHVRHWIKFCFWSDLRPGITVLWVAPHITA
jgi:hypothetical protein